LPQKKLWWLFAGTATLANKPQAEFACGLGYV
jgi:hypothetical protein